MKKTTKKLNKKEEAKDTWLADAKEFEGFEKEYDKFIKEQKKLKVKRQEEELNKQVGDFLKDVVDDGSKPTVEYTDMPMPDFNYSPYNSTYDLNDFNTQVTIPADGGLKDELNDIKNLLKSMNDNLDKILHHLNGGWN